MTKQAGHKRSSTPSNPKICFRQGHGRHNCARAASTESRYSSGPPRLSEKAPLLLPQRPRTPLTVQEDLSHLCAVVCRPHSFPDDLCEPQTRACGNAMPASPCVHYALLSPMSPTDSCDGICKHHHGVIQPGPVQKAEYDMQQLTTAASQRASDEVVVLSSKFDGHVSSRAATERSSILLASGRQQGSEPFSNCSGSGQNNSHANQRRLASLDSVSMPARKAAIAVDAAEERCLPVKAGRGRYVSMTWTDNFTESKESAHTGHAAVVAGAPVNRLRSESVRAHTRASASDASTHEAGRVGVANACEKTHASAVTRSRRRATMPDMGLASHQSNPNTQQPVVAAAVEKTYAAGRSREGRHLPAPRPEVIHFRSDEAAFNLEAPLALVNGSDDPSQSDKWRRATRRVLRPSPNTSVTPDSRGSSTREPSMSPASTSSEPQTARLASECIQRWLQPRVRSRRRASKTMPDCAPAIGEDDSQEFYGLHKQREVRGSTAPAPDSVITVTPVDTSTLTPVDTGTVTPVDTRTLRRHAGRQVTKRDALLRYSFDLGIPMGLVSQAYDVFIEHAELNGGGNSSSSAEGSLGFNRFTQVLCKIADIANPDDLPKNLLHDAFKLADQDGSNNIDFKEFVMWYSKYGFSESLLCSKEQREIREIARKLGLSIPDIENFKSSFDRFDEDNSGAIDMHEFENVLGVLLKVPPHVQIPPCRIRQLWQEMDVDNSGHISFEEFVAFYLNHFGCDSIAPTASAYSAFRRSTVHKWCAA